mmetsp:Transcript_27221/g.48125  ORF Transcript_27221/g.48125 Transcript_27221/m.48125 type:complete len:582 (+) Transcript_27221:193-1938(+)
MPWADSLKKGWSRVKQSLFALLVFVGSQVSALRNLATSTKTFCQAASKSVSTAWASGSSSLAQFYVKCRDFGGVDVYGKCKDLGGRIADSELAERVSSSATPVRMFIFIAFLVFTLSPALIVTSFLSHRSLHDLNKYQTPSDSITIPRTSPANNPNPNPNPGPTNPNANANQNEENDDDDRSESSGRTTSARGGVEIEKIRRHVNGREPPVSRSKNNRVKDPTFPQDSDSSIMVLREFSNFYNVSDSPILSEHSGSPLESFEVSPKYRLLMCRIDKNANSNLIEMSHRLNGRPWGLSQREHFNLTRKDLDSILQNPTWRKAVIFRDPLVRLLSAYLSKCVLHEDSPCVDPVTRQYAYTSGCEKGADGNNIPNGGCLGFEDFEYVRNTVGFDEFVANLKEEISSMSETDWGNNIFNQHFLPQHRFCGGLDASIQLYSHVYSFEDIRLDRIHKGISDSSVSVSDSGQSSERISNTRRLSVKHFQRLVAEMRDDPTLPELPRDFAVEDMFPSDDSEPQTHKSGALEKMETYYRNHTTLMTALEIYREDYKFLEDVVGFRRRLPKGLQAVVDKIEAVNAKNDQIS